MAWRRIIGLLAVIAMLANAGMVSLHVQIAEAAARAMAGASASTTDATGIWIVCGAKSQQTADKTSGAPGPSHPERSMFGACPLCAGLAAAFVLAEQQELAAAPLVTSTRVRGEPSLHIPPSTPGPWPPNRGPPVPFAQA